MEARKMPSRLFFDFLRGVIDGDGTIQKYFDPVYKNSLRLYVKITSASPAFLDWLRSEIRKLAKLRGFIKKVGHDYHELAFAKNESITLLNEIYYKPGLALLTRKFEKAKQFLKN